PGGYVYVTRGLLALCNSEDELAGVIGHEMAHVLERHAARRAGAATPFAVLFGIPAGILGAISPSLGGIVGGTGELASGMVLASYSRDQERDADKRGIVLPAGGGWGPAQLGLLPPPARARGGPGRARPHPSRVLRRASRHARARGKHPHGRPRPDSREGGDDRRNARRVRPEARGPRGRRQSG